MEQMSSNFLIELLVVPEKVAANSYCLCAGGIELQTDSFIKINLQACKCFAVGWRAGGGAYGIYGSRQKVQSLLHGTGMAYTKLSYKACANGTSYTCTKEGAACLFTILFCPIPIF